MSYIQAEAVHSTNFLYIQNFQYITLRFLRKIIKVDRASPESFKEKKTNLNICFT